MANQHSWLENAPGLKMQFPIENGVIFRCQLLLMEEILHQLRLVVYPIIYEVYIFQGGFLAGFLVAINSR